MKDAKEIKEEMSKGEWEVSEADSANVLSGAYEDDYILTCDSDNDGIETDHANAAAIVSAVNATYGAGYDPAKMLEFMQGFEVFMKNGITAYPTTGKKLINLFNEAKIK